MPATDRRDVRESVVAALALGIAVQLMPATAAAPAPPPVTAPAPAWTARPFVLSDLPDEAGAVRTVALTFDDGPDPRWTPQVLDVLHRHGAVATFCMIGTQAAAHPYLVRTVVDAGMRLCDHSRTHDLDLPARSPQQLAGEVTGTRATIADASGGAHVGYFRAPGGNWSPAILDMASSDGMQALGWSVDARDWRRPGVAAIVTAVQQQVHPGAVILLHDGGGHRDQTLAALEQLLPWLVGQGYEFGFPTP